MNIAVLPSPCLDRVSDSNIRSSDVAWLKRDVLLFAASIGCTVDELHFLYELHPNFAVFPTYSIILPFKRTSQEVIDFYAAQAAVSIPDVPKAGFEACGRWAKEDRVSEAAADELGWERGSS